MDNKWSESLAKSLYKLKNLELKTQLEEQLRNLEAQVREVSEQIKKIDWELYLEEKENETITINIDSNYSWDSIYLRASDTIQRQSDYTLTVTKDNTSFTFHNVILSQLSDFKIEGTNELDKPTFES